MAVTRAPVAARGRPASMIESCTERTQSPMRYKIEAWESTGGAAVEVDMNERPACPGGLNAANPGCTAPPDHVLT